MASHNGVTWLDDNADTSEIQYMYTDASSVAAAAVYQNSWSIREFKGESAWMFPKAIVMYNYAISVA